MKVLHLRSPKGTFGAENLIISLAKEQMKSGIDVLVGILDDGMPENVDLIKKIKNENIPLIYIPCKRFELNAFKRIRNLLKDEGVDIIHSHGYKEDFYSFFSSFGIRRLIKIATCHTWYSENFKMKFYEFMDKLILRRFSKIVCVSLALAEELEKSGFPKDKIAMVVNGVEVGNCKSESDFIELKKSFEISPIDFIIGTVGRLSNSKGQIRIIKSMPKLLDHIPNLKYLIIGDGVLRKDLEDLCRKLGLKGKVIFAGIRKDISDLLAILDIFVLPSTKEGLPIALLEAMAAKKTIVASDVGAVNIAIKNDFNGRLVSPENEDEIVSVIIELFADKKKADFLANNALKDVELKFSSKAMSQEYLKIYRSFYAG